MRVKLVQDAIRLASMAYWSKEDLEKLNVKFEEKPEKNTVVEEKDDDSDVSSVDATKGDDDKPAEEAKGGGAAGAVEDDTATEEVAKPEPVVPKTRDELIMEKLTKPIQFYSTPADAQCFVTRYEDGCCMVFRGTTNIKDWMTNIKATQVAIDLPGVFGSDRPEAHAGFVSQFQSLSMTLMQYANAYMNDGTVKESNKTFYYMGHSLGGALSTVAAVIFGAMFPDARHVCITFGSPRVGDAKFVQLFHKHVDETVRCVNQEDPVPMVPTACRFEHVGGVHYIDKDHKIQDEITENRLLNSCKDSILCCCGLAENPLDDHDTEQYEAVWKSIQ